MKSQQTQSSKAFVNGAQTESLSPSAAALLSPLSAEEWWHVFDNVNDPVMLVNSDFRVRLVNKAMAKYLGLPAEDLVGRTCYSLCHGLEAPMPLCPHSMVLQDHQAHSEECIDPRTGKPLLVSVTPFFDASGACNGTFHYIKDLTDHYELLIMLKESRENYRSVIDAQNEAVIGLDSKYRITFVNDFSCSVLGKSRKDLLGKGWLEEIHPEDAGSMEEILMSLRSDMSQSTVVCRFCNIAVTQNWLQFSCRLLSNDSGGCAAYQLIGRDISDVKHRDERVIARLAACRDLLARLPSFGSGHNETIGSVSELLGTVIEDIEKQTSNSRPPQGSAMAAKLSETHHKESFSVKLQTGRGTTK